MHSHKIVVAGGLAMVEGAHVGFDRALGYGLKYSTFFGDTHLGGIGRRPRRRRSDRGARIRMTDNVFPGAILLPAGGGALAPAATMVFSRDGDARAGACRRNTIDSAAGNRGLPAKKVM